MKTRIEIVDVDFKRTEIRGFVEGSQIFTIAKDKTGNDRGWYVSGSTCPGGKLEWSLAVIVVSLTCHRLTHTFDRGAARVGDFVENVHLLTV